MFILFEIHWDPCPRIFDTYYSIYRHCERYCSKTEKCVHKRTCLRNRIAWIFSMLICRRLHFDMNFITYHFYCRLIFRWFLLFCMYFLRYSSDLFQCHFLPWPNWMKIKSVINYLLFMIGLLLCKVEIHKNKI